MRSGHKHCHCRPVGIVSLPVLPLQSFPEWLLRSTAHLAHLRPNRNGFQVRRGTSCGCMLLKGGGGLEPFVVGGKRCAECCSQHGEVRQQGSRCPSPLRAFGWNGLCPSRRG